MIQFRGFRCWSLTSPVPTAVSDSVARQRSERDGVKHTENTRPAADGSALKSQTPVKQRE